MSNYMNYEDFWQEDRFKIDIESNYPISPKQKKKEKEEKKKKKQSKPRKQKIIEIKESNEVKEEYKERESRSDWWKFEETIKTEMEENKSFSSFRKGIVEKYFNIAKNIKDSNKLSELFHIRILRATDFVVDDAIRSLANMLILFEKLGGRLEFKIEEVKDFLFKEVIYAPSSSKNVEGRRNLFIQLKNFSSLKDNNQINFDKALLFVLDDMCEDIKAQKDGITVVIDLKDYKSDIISHGFLKHINFLLLECAFIKVNEIIIANQPIFFHSVEKSLAAFKEKYIFLKKSPIIKHISPHNLPNYIGGTISMNLEIKFFISEKEENKVKKKTSALEKSGKAVGLLDLIKLPNKLVKQFVMTTSQNRTREPPSTRKSEESVSEVFPKFPLSTSEKVKSLEELFRCHSDTLSNSSSSNDKIDIDDDIILKSDVVFEDDSKILESTSILAEESLILKNSTSSEDDDLPLLDDEDLPYEKIDELVCSFAGKVFPLTSAETSPIEAYIFSENFFSLFKKDVKYQSFDFSSFLDGLDKSSFLFDKDLFYDIFIISEKKYLNVLSLLHSSYMLPLRTYFTQLAVQKGFNSTKKISFVKQMEHQIFSNFREICDFHHSFFERLDQENFFTSLGTFSRNLEKYTLFCSNLRVSFFSLLQLSKKKRFQLFLSKLEKSCEPPFLLSSLLFYPFVRLVFYAKFFDFLHNFTKEEITKIFYKEARDSIMLILNLILQS